VGEVLLWGLVSVVRILLAGEVEEWARGYLWSGGGWGGGGVRVQVLFGVGGGRVWGGLGGVACGGAG